MYLSAVKRFYSTLSPAFLPALIRSPFPSDRFSRPRRWRDTQGTRSILLVFADCQVARDPTCILIIIVRRFIPLNGYSCAPSIPSNFPFTESSKLTPGQPCVENGMGVRGVQSPRGVLLAYRDCGTNVPRFFCRKHPLEGGGRKHRGTLIHIERGDT